MQPAAITVSKMLSAKDVPAEVAEVTLGTVVRVESTRMRDTLAAFLAAGYESLVDLDGIDTGEAIEITYRLRSYRDDLEVFVKTTVPYEAEVASVWRIYPASLMPERELSEMFGLSLAGHPNPKHLFLTDGVPPLLLKRVPIRTHEEVQR